MDRYTVISKRFHFSSAHFLPNYDGLCNNLHGHRWECDVYVVGKVKEDGMVMDYHILSSIVNPIIKELDHNLLNNIIKNPTAENIAEYLWNRINGDLGEDILKKIVVWESPGCSATLKRDDFINEYEPMGICFPD